MIKIIPMNRDVRFTPPAAFDEGLLDRGDGHRLWYGQYGNPRGTPLLWLHGGPGSASGLRQLDLIDLAHYRVVLFDQRGCGRSLPAGALHRNETHLLVEDLCALRTHLALGPVVLGGGSWGAALALVHTATHHAGVAALVLRAPFLAAQSEIDAFLMPATANTDSAWADFAALAPPSQRGALLPWLAQQLACASHAQCVRIARGWHCYEQLRGTGAVTAPTRAEEAALIARYRIQAHYLLQRCFLGEGAVLAAACALPPMPVALIHGDADRICSPRNAQLLHARLPHSRLRMLPGAGHDPFHPGMASALAQALQCYARDASFDEWEQRND